jgi:hypothetical protein
VESSDLSGGLLLGCTTKAISYRSRWPAELALQFNPVETKQPNPAGRKKKKKDGSVLFPYINAELKIKL